MIFKERNIKKSDEEKALDDALEAYEKKYGEPYTFTIGFNNETTEETTKEILRLIREGKKQEKPETEKGVIY